MIKTIFLALIAALVYSFPVLGQDSGHDHSAHDHSTHMGEPHKDVDHSGHEMKHDEMAHDHEAMMREQEQMDPEELQRKVGVDEKLGQMIPLDLHVMDETGKHLLLKDLIDKPTLLLIIFYRCPASCSIMLGQLANVINAMPSKLSKDYNVLTFSIDAEDTPQFAAERKVNYTKILKPEIPGEDWKFLTASQEVIDKLTSSVGYRHFKLDKHNFVHPNVLIALSPKGKIIRYLYGPNFLTFDVSMALTEAQKGTPGISIKRLLSFCFNYDPEGKKYVFNFMRVASIVVLGLLLVFVIFLTRRRKND
jgi:protein SCO1/2